MPTGLGAMAIAAVAVSGCGSARVINPKAIAFEPTVLGCSASPTECSSGNAALLSEWRRARNHLCPEGKADVLIKVNGAIVCVATLPSAGPSGIGVAMPSVVRARGEGAYFRAGEALAARNGCLARHRIAESGNNGPGSDLTHIGSRLAPAALERALVDSREPMPSFSRMPEPQRRALVYFLAQLR